MQTGNTLFPTRLKYFRRLRSWSQAELASQVGVSEKTVSRWESGQRTPHPYASQKLCKIFNTDAEGLGLLPPLEQQEDQHSDLLNQEREAVQKSRNEDWGEAPDEQEFYGRLQEITTLKELIQDKHCRVIAIFGVGGVGKTTLAAHLARAVSSTFTFVFWRSLENAPPLKEILKQSLPILSNQRDTSTTAVIDELISSFIHYLQENRCLIIFDNVEAIMQSGQSVGKYRPGYEAYGELFRRLGESKHQSCVLLTSREKPKEITLLTSQKSLTQSFILTGVERNSAQQILIQKGLVGLDQEITKLVNLYSGNPLALKLVAPYIYDVFDSQIAPFLKEQGTVFGDITTLLDQQFQRLSLQEQELLYWLAIEREAVSLETIRNTLVDTPAGTVLETISSLLNRSMVEKEIGGNFHLQPVILEYVSIKLVDLFLSAFDKQENTTWNDYALLKAQSKDYIRESQRLLLLGLVTKKLLDQYKTKDLEQAANRMLDRQKTLPSSQSGYLASNILHLLVQARCDLRNVDFSEQSIRQAYLQDVVLHDVNFSSAHFAESSFTSTFGNIPGLTFSAYGDSLAIGTATGLIWIYETTTWTPRLVCKGHTDAVWSVAFTPDGQILASASDDRTIRLWDAATGECLRVLEKHTDRVRSIAFTKEGRYLVSGGEDALAYLWDHQTGECIYEFKGHTDRIWSLAVSSDGKHLATGSTDQTIRLWDLQSGICLHTLQGHTQEIRGLAFQPEQSILASGSDDRTIRLWDTETGICRKVLTGHTHRVWCLAFSPDGLAIASGDEACNVRIWDIQTYRCTGIMQGHLHGIRAIAFHPDGKTLASGGDDHTIRLWDIRTYQCLKTFQGHTNRVWSLAFNIDGKTLVSSNEDRIIYLWNTETAKCSQTLRDTAHGVRAIDLSPDGKLLVSGGEDQIVRLWNLQTGQQIRQFSGHSAWIRTVAFATDGEWLASGGEDQNIHLWSLNFERQHSILRGHTGWVRALAFRPGSNQLASGGDDHTIRIWTYGEKAGQELTILRGHTNRIRALAFRSDGRILASGSEDLSIYLWSLTTNQIVHTLCGHTNRVRVLAFSPDSHLLVSGSDDYTIRLWRTDTGQCIDVLRGHTDRVRGIAFSPDGSQIASSSDDETIRLWDVHTSQIVKILVSDRPYERMNISYARGLHSAQRAALHSLGAIETIDKQTNQQEPHYSV